MDYEKKYKEALEKAQDILHSSEIVKITDIFPELKESEDERIRKNLIEFLDSVWHLGKNANFDKWGKADCSVWIAWLEKQGENDSNKMPIWKHWKDGIAGNGEGKPIYLVKIGNTYSLNSCLGFECDYIELSELDNLMLEKQGEQKPFNYENANIQQKDFAPKVEPKFHEGEWIVQENIGIYKVIEVCESWYEVIDNQNNHYSIGFDKEYMCHPWTIQDAKDGDVLADDYGIYIFEKFDECDKNCYVCIGAYQYSQKAYECEHMLCSTDAHPATKEQRDLLFQKMKEAGYEWDAENKELNKIEQKPTDKVEPTSDFEISLKNIMEEAIECGDTHNLKADAELLYNIVQKPTWSEEDEKLFNRICYIIHSAAFENSETNDVGNELGEYAKMMCLLKSLKDRVQPKQEWSKEDEELMRWSINNLTELKDRFGEEYGKVGDCIIWLKSLKERIGG